MISVVRLSSSSFSRKSASRYKNAKKAIDEVENGQKNADPDGKAGLKLLESAKALANHIEKEPAFDTVNDMGPVGIETCQSDEFVEVIQKTNNTIQEAENSLS